MKNAKRTVAVLVAFLMAVSLGWAIDLLAQTKPPTAPGAGAPAAEKMEVQGKIKSADLGRGIVTLEDGTQLMIPPTVRVQREALKAGATVKASYEEKGGQKVVTSMEVQAAERGPAKPK